MKLTPRCANSRGRGRTDKESDMTQYTHAQTRVLSRIDVRDCGYETPCWISNRAAQPNGYTKIGDRGLTKLTHRYSYEAFVGAIPDGLQLDHLCRQRACCNPDHLEPVTISINARRGERGSRTRCINDHPLSGDNLYLRPDRYGRMCRTCRAESKHRSAERRKAAA